MHKIVVAGAGHVGETIASMLLATGDYAVTLVDPSADALGSIEDRPGLTKTKADASDEAALGPILEGQFAVLSAAPYHVTRHIATVAVAKGVHYLDLTEDVQSTQHVKTLSGTARSALIPQCGLAPGFISIAGHHLASRFDTLDTLHMRVGALPQFPTNSLGYNLTWNTEGVINEYCRPCEAIVNGEPATVPPLEELEHFSLGGVTYEAFNTSGGLGTLCETLLGKVRFLNYRTIRYPGHRDIMKTLIHDLRLGDDPALFKQILENALPTTQQDVVLIFITAWGQRDGRMVQESYASKTYAQRMPDGHGSERIRTAIQITTASGICAVLDMLAAGDLPQQGLVRQEQIDLGAFLANRFGSVYAEGDGHHSLPLTAAELNGQGPRP